MASNHSSRPSVGRLLLTAFTLGLSFMALLPGPARARIRTCRRDPLVTLSNGKVVRMSALIGADTDEVQWVHYELHAPKGTTVTRIVYTGGVPCSDKEFVSFYADAAEGAYSVSTLVHVPGQTVQVTAYDAVNNAKQDGGGWSGQPVTVYITAEDKDRGPDKDKKDKK